jgi:translation initiation factor IF-3
MIEKKSFCFLKEISFNFLLIQKTPVNNQIKAERLRVIDEEGKSLGIVTIQEALEKAKIAHLDLVLVSAKTNPPISKITDAGKYFYQQHKKFKSNKMGGDVKVIKIKFNTSPHDLEVKLKHAKAFLEKKHQVQVVMSLRGRENALRTQAQEKLTHFIEMIQQEISVKVQNQSQSKSHQLKVSLSR